MPCLAVESAVPDQSRRGQHCAQRQTNAVSVSGHLILLPATDPCIKNLEESVGTRLLYRILRCSPQEA
jgi:hypothetical protein